MTYPTRERQNASTLHSPEEIYTVYEDISPLKAEEYLKRNIDNYRKLRPQWVEKLASDMRESRWVTTHQGIAFNREGRFIDGQHRLRAIIKSGCTVKMAVTYNLESRALHYVDQGDPRSVRDILKAQGVEGLRNSLVGIARLLCFRMPNQQQTPSKSRVVAMFYQHEAAIRGVDGMVKTGLRRVEVASVLTPVVRAWYSADHYKLQEFTEILNHGFLDGAEMTRAKCVLLLRDYLLSTKTAAGREMTKEIYFKTERALHAYLNSEPLGRLHAATMELFPLPEEQE